MKKEVSKTKARRKARRTDKKLYEKTDRQRITMGMKALRKLGYFAKANHTCCSTCGWAEIPDEESDKAVFYHNQDADHIVKGTIEDSLYLSWSGDGDVIVQEFQKVGFEVAWDGTHESRIKLQHNPRLEYIVGCDGLRK